MEKRKSNLPKKKSDKESHHLENSYGSISVSKILGKISERIILQQATNILEKNSFFKGKNLYAHQKNKNALQALLPLEEQMCKGVVRSKYGISVFANMQGAFDDSVEEGGTI